MAETVIVLSSEYPPWAGQKLYQLGYVNHVVKESYQQVSVTAEFRFVPWDTLKDELTDKEYDAVSFGLKLKGEHADEFLMTLPVMHEEVRFLTLAQHSLLKWNTFEDLKKYRIGATRGIPYMLGFWEAKEAGVLNVELAESDFENMNKLLLGTIDLFPMGKTVGGLQINRHLHQMRSQFKWVRKPLYKFAGHVYYPKEKPQSHLWLRLFNEGYRKLTKSGKLDMMKRHFLAGKYDHKEE
ncbi:substrate-binding periplasmic protein [Algicola sagamiensis]|uniref:substrate-binding periplasmic protein n=1 Tax=Algicola sagamiensis TaxID=163869 RepID=UPI00146F52EB|nr:transporter substrate-binding domain-containing protein [Algicola sagamiensis]